MLRLPSKDRRFTRKLLKLAMGTSPSQMKRGVSERELISQESKIGRQLFGPIPKGHTREFFCLDKTTWIWHESWVDPRNGRRAECTTRYEIHPHCVLKIQDGQPYKEVTGQELYNLTLACRQYYLRTSSEVYGHAVPQGA
jgi:hypothetical protein